MKEPKWYISKELNHEIQTLKLWRYLGIPPTSFNYAAMHETRLFQIEYLQ